MTVAPISTASRGLPRVPTMYAAINVLPCPGSAACEAPSSKLSSTAAIPTPHVR